ncbi:hypothetical protein IJT93_00410, partial [bacterium]|nr:hypothetical protein [bacterium]
MSSDGRYQIEIIEGIDQGTVFTLFGDTIKLSGGTFTSFEDGIIKIKNSSVSSIIGVLNWEEESNAYRLSNRSAISPVTVNGSPCSNALLVDGSLIQVGEAVIEIIACEGVVANEHGVTATDFSAASSDSETVIYLGEAAEQPRKRVVPAWLRTGDDAPGEAVNNAPVRDLLGGCQDEEERRSSSLGYGRHSYVPESKRKYKDYAPASRLNSKEELEACKTSEDDSESAEADAAEDIGRTLIQTDNTNQEQAAPFEDEAAEPDAFPPEYEAGSEGEGEVYPQSYEGQAGSDAYAQGYEGRHEGEAYPQGYDVQAEGEAYSHGYEGQAEGEAYPQGYAGQAEGEAYPQGYNVQAGGEAYPQGYAGQAEGEA